MQKVCNLCLQILEIVFFLTQFISQISPEKKIEFGLKFDGKQEIVIFQEKKTYKILMQSIPERGLALGDSGQIEPKSHTNHPRSEKTGNIFFLKIKLFQKILISNQVATSASVISPLHNFSKSRSILRQNN